MQTSTATTKSGSWPPLSYDAYKPDHPWYFMLGGPIPTPKAIKQMVLSEGYHGYDRERSAPSLQSPNRAAHAS